MFLIVTASWFLAPAKHISTLIITCILPPTNLSRSSMSPLQSYDHIKNSYMQKHASKTHQFIKPRLIHVIILEADKYIIFLEVA